MTEGQRQTDRQTDSTQSPRVGALFGSCARGLDQPGGYPPILIGCRTVHAFASAHREVRPNEHWLATHEKGKKVTRYFVCSGSYVCT